MNTGLLVDLPKGQGAVCHVERIIAHLGQRGKRTRSLGVSQFCRAGPLAFSPGRKREGYTVTLKKEMCPHSPDGENLYIGQFRVQ